MQVSFFNRTNKIIAPRIPRLTMALFHAGIAVFLYALCGYADGIQCRDGWVTYQSSCYLFARTYSVTFTEAEHYCRDRGGHLVQLDSQAENYFVRDFLRGMTSADHWIGMTDETVEGIWKWFSSGKIATYTDWAPGEPNNDGNEDCAILRSPLDYRWEDRKCIDRYEPICEMESDGSAIVG